MLNHRNCDLVHISTLYATHYQNTEYYLFYWSFQPIETNFHLSFLVLRVINYSLVGIQNTTGVFCLMHRIIGKLQFIALQSIFIPILRLFRVGKVLTLKVFYLTLMLHKGIKYEGCQNVSYSTLLTLDIVGVIFWLHL